MYNKVEQEVILLNAVWKMIGGMVNYQLFVKGHGTEDVTLTFNTNVHARLFTILLVDFLSRPQANRAGVMPFGLPDPGKDARPIQNTYLHYLLLICDEPHLGNDASALRLSVESFMKWLQASALIDAVYLPSLDLTLDVTITRLLMLQISGDVAKHNFSRLQGNVSRVRTVLADSGHVIDEQEGYQVLPELYEWFSEYILPYHASTIARFLNDIRWAIFEYLYPLYERCLVRYSDGQFHTLELPDAIQQPIAMAMCWDLLNKVRTPPYFPRFTVPEIMMKRY